MLSLRVFYKSDKVVGLALGENWTCIRKKFVKVDYQLTRNDREL